MSMVILFLSQNIYPVVKKSCGFPMALAGPCEEEARSEVASPIIRRDTCKKVPQCSKFIGTEYPNDIFAAFKDRRQILLYSGHNTKGFGMSCNGRYLGTEEFFPLDVSNFACN